MKKLYFTILLLIPAFILNAQNFQWAKKGGLYAYDYGYGVCTDANGNVYVAGKYEENANFDGITVTCQGNHDVFVAKYNSAGVIQWVRTGGGLSGDYAHGIACDASGNVYIAGEIEGTVNFGSVQVVGNPGTDDAFVAKYSTNGDLIWVKSYGGGSRDDARGIAVDGSGNSYIIGVFRDQANFGSQVVVSASANIDDIFVAKLDPNGGVVWVRAMGSVGDDTGKAIALDGSGNVYAVGGFIGTANFGAISLTAPNGYRDMYIAKISNDGNFQWVKQGGGDYDDVAWAVTVDNSGNAYAAGEFNAYATFGSLALTTGGEADGFVVKYDPSGNVTWANRIGGTLVDRIRAIATDNSNVYFTGQYGGTISMGSYTKTSADSSDIFIASYTTSGGNGWIVAPSGPADAYDDLGFEAGNAIHAAGGYVYASGSYLTGNEDFNGAVLSKWDRTDMFVTKIDQGLSGVNDLALLSSSFTVLPNPAKGTAVLSFNSEKNSDYKVRITNNLGQVIYDDNLNNIHGSYKKSLDLSDYDKGIYMISVTSDNEKAIQKLVIQ